MPTYHAHVPVAAPIDAYGNGGFRFAGMSHRGAIVCVASGIYGVAVDDPDALAAAALERIDADAAGSPAKARPIALLLGTGPIQLWPAPDTERRFVAAGITLEPMTTGAACRTWNILLAEGRAVAAAVLAVP